jgi:hypothetical protein
MTTGVLWMLLVLSAVYAVILLGMILLLHKIGVSRKSAVVLGFLIFGVVTGILTAWAWPIESSIYFNVYGTWLGDQAYGLAIRTIGDEGSSQAHYTIPWLLRIPQVYVITCILVSGLVGLVAQWVYVRRDGER